MSLTPMMQQYLDIKNEHTDHLLMFRLGDFYEMFFDDAVTASRVLDITLTGRDAGSAGRIPMCGVPYHAAEQYITRLVEEGFCVAICEQVEDPKATKGLVRREVIRVITPGTSLHDDGQKNRFMATVVERRGEFGVGLIDVGTGEVWCGQFSESQKALEVLVQYKPVEVVRYEVADSLEDIVFDWLDTLQSLSKFRTTYRKESRSATDDAKKRVLEQYRVANLQPLDLDTYPLACEAVGMGFLYLDETQKQSLSHIRAPHIFGRDEYLVLDHAALSTLEVTESTKSRTRKGSLFGLLDRTKTSMGSRMLRRWLERPLYETNRITQRLNAVEWLLKNLFIASRVGELLDEVYDLERLAGRISFGTANGRDLRSIARSIAVLPELKRGMLESQVDLLVEIGEKMPTLEALADKILEFIVSEPPISVRDGNLIQSGVDAELDELRTINQSSKSWLAELENRERTRTGIKALKIGYNKVFGYYIEVSKANTHLVPDDYERRQTLASAERYILPELKERESMILNAEERAMEREFELFTELRSLVLGHLTEIQLASDQIATVDALLALSMVSRDHRYVRPEVTSERGIEIEGGRHPVVEAHSSTRFVPNDTLLNASQELILITGPNMAGKSTFMRQTALIVILAHIGCFVPAKRAKIGMVDRIFTRIGASDDLAAGQSTFMVEMVELAQILRQSTERSLVLLDEIGRGTSTYDGLSIAEAVMETLQNGTSRPLTLFATHYHELTQVARTLPTAANYSVRVEESETGIRFLHTLVNRPADRSYGIQVAKLAGIPEHVILRAHDILESREGSQQTSGQNPALVRETAATKEDILPLFSEPKNTVIQKLADTDVERMTPMEAMNVLYKLVQEAKEVVDWETSK